MVPGRGVDTPRQHAITLAFVALFIVTVAWRGFDFAVNGALLTIVLVFSWGHTAYIAMIQQRAAERPVTLEAGRWFSGTALGSSSPRSIWLSRSTPSTSTTPVSGFSTRSGKGEASGSGLGYL